MWEHDEPAGRGTDTLPGGEWLHVPARDRARHGRRPRAPADEADAASPLDQRQLLEALAGQAAVAIERTRIDVVLEEQAKTEAVIETIEDGLVVLDPDGVVAARERGRVRHPRASSAREALGPRFDDLGTSHPHYLRLRDGGRASSSRIPSASASRVEIALFLRGRDHYYVLRPTPLPRARRDARRASSSCSRT